MVYMNLQCIDAIHSCVQYDSGDDVYKGNIASSITSRRSQGLREGGMLPPDNVVLPANRYILNMRQKVIEAAIPRLWHGGAVGAVSLLELAVVEGSNSLGLDLLHLLRCERRTLLLYTSSPESYCTHE